MAGYMNIQAKKPLVSREDLLKAFDLITYSEGLCMLCAEALKQDELSKMQSISDIIRNNSLVADFQQIVSVSRKMVIGLEGLIRGIDPNTKERIPPKKLFDAAMRENMALEFDRACRDTVIGAFSRIYALNHEKLLFLNLDASVLHNAVGSDYLLEQVRRHGVNPGNIVIEISEKKVEGSAALKRFADAYRRYGFLVALDDVGCESSNIDRILLVKPDIIKIDISLIRHIQNDFYKQGVFKALVNMSNKIGALVIAEGAETEDEAIQVLRLGGHMIQGFYFSEPQPVDDETAFVNHKIDLLSKRFNDYMNRQYAEERNRSKRLHAAASRAAKKLALLTRREFDGALREIMSKTGTMECAYILDSSGVQISDTVCAAKKAACLENLIFYSARRGTDHSMEKYYYPLVSARIKKHITQPYISLATGNLCVTVSVTFTNAETSSCILCIDFKSSDDAGDTELKSPLPHFYRSPEPDMLSVIDRMNEALIRDSLTGAYNRRYIEERLLADVFNATNEDQPISIILADIDHFKSVNDRYGHPAGDRVLKEFVRISKRFVRRNTDWVARYGGDEFLIVLINADEATAAAVAEKIRAAASMTALVQEGEDIFFTASFGTYTVHSKKMTCDQLIGQADRNLYIAKALGRNKVAEGVRV
jgi:diguanylate cyclase (GGDEF)-like protein